MPADRTVGARLLAATAAVAMVVTACTSEGGGDGGDGGEEAAPEDAGYCAEGGHGTIRWAHAQEPPDLHHDDPANGLAISSWIQQGMFEGLYGVTTTHEFVPELLAEDGEVSEDDDGTVTYRFTLRDDLRWSDGVPITGSTVEDNFHLLVAAADAAEDRSELAVAAGDGYELIDPDSWEVDGQRFSYTAERFFPGWRSLFARILPVHVLEDAATTDEALRELALDGEPLPASGPFQVVGWERGASLRLAANDDYHGANPANDEIANPGAPCASAVEVRFDVDGSVVEALRAGEADLVVAPPEVGFAEVVADEPSITVASRPGPVFEHWSLNVTNPHLQDPEVREALAYAIDKRQLVDSLYRPLFGDALPPGGLGSTYWLPDNPHHVDHQGRAGYGAGDVERASALLEGAGYTENGEGFWEHPERGQLTLRVSTTAGDHLRELQQQQLAAQLEAAGFDIRVDNVPGADFFAQRAFHPGHVACSITQGDEGATVRLSGGVDAVADCDIVDIVQFSWSGGPSPGDQHVAYRTGSEDNPHAYGNPDLDALLAECDRTIDDRERADCYNTADEHVTTRNVDRDGLVIVPLSQKPSFYAYSGDRLQRAALVPDAVDAGPLAYAVDFVPAGPGGTSPDERDGGAAGR